MFAFGVVKILVLDIDGGCFLLCFVCALGVAKVLVVDIDFGGLS